MTKLNKAGMPEFSMWLQAIIVCVFIFFVSFGGSGAKQFYTILTDMGNISTSFPYIFLIGAFPFFKRRTDLERPFVFFKNRIITNIIVVVVLIVLIGGIGFSAVQPFLDHDYQTGFWTIGGPIIFGLIAWLFLIQAHHRQRKI
ncbi:putative amino acid permease [Lentilactobacillus kosonis]|uniref:Putative amino acid permease n=1 Tax=Lentilactobacillus kosonis TaxID=2810561 RepID=A0A401FN02_9LACO|nr:putative amino acid permease [Lentilactobacillus kosonis]